MPAKRPGSHGTLNAMPDTRTPVFVSTMTNDRFEVFHSFVHVEDGLRLHTHDHYEINCVLDGTAAFHVDDRLVETRPGSVIMINPGVVHNVVRQTTPRYERVYLHITPRFLQAVSTPNTDLERCFRTADGVPTNRVLAMQVAQLHETLDPLLHAPTAAYGEDLRHERQLVDAMIRFNELAMAGTDMQPLPKMNVAYSPTVARAMRYIDEHIGEDLCLDAIAAYCATNKFSLSRDFKRELGTTPARFVQSRRLQRSRRLLPQLGSPKLIYRMCGFKSYTHFLRSFQQEFGMTTGEFLEWSRTPADRREA